MTRKKVPQLFAGVVVTIVIDHSSWSWRSIAAVAEKSDCGIPFLLKRFFNQVMGTTFGGVHCDENIGTSI